MGRGYSNLRPLIIIMIKLFIIACLIILFCLCRKKEKKIEKKEAEVVMPLPEIGLSSDIVHFLETYDFLGADRLFLTDKPVSKKEYEKTKAIYVKTYLDGCLKKRFGHSIDKEKSLAVSKIAQNVLIKAGAGAGKTMTIAYKAYFLVKKENIKPEEIMVLAFNKNAANEIENKIKIKFNLIGIKNIRTFHSLAYQIAKPREKVLVNQDSYIRVIAERVMNKKISPETVRLFVQFVQRAKKSLMGPEVIDGEINGYNSKDFLLLANRIYREYEKSLLRNNFIDYDDLITKATETINRTTGGCRINDVAVNRLKYIMIDEFQDFSALFSSMLHAVKKHNPAVGLFCVGDENQAINGFAGSDLKYFRDFLKNDRDSDIGYLLTNYRSKKEIVDCGNRFISGNEVKSRYSAGNEDGEIIVKYIEDANDGNCMETGYLKACQDIIRNNPDKTIAVLHRKKDIGETSLPVFLKKLKRRNNFDDRVTISTVHGYKGMESDIVIIMEVCRNIFPILHSHGDMFDIFGHDYNDILKEEIRLFYVAVTRAKEKLFILTEKGKESYFVSLLGK